MGTWGHEPFDNDGASDVVYEVEEIESWGEFREIFNEWTAALDAEGGEESVALAAMVAASHGRAAKLLSDEAAAAIKKFKPAPKSLVTKARKAVAQVLENSDLKSRWAEDKPGARQWVRTTRKLLDELVELEAEATK